MSAGRSNDVDPSTQAELLPMRLSERLRVQRLKRGLELATAAIATRIPRETLDALEQDQIDDLPAVYLRGYLRTYGRYLGLSDEVIEAGLAEYRNDAPPPRPVFAGAPRRNAVDRWLRVSSYLVASLLIGTLAWQVTHEAMRLADDAPQRGPVDVSEGSAPERSRVNASIASLENLRDRPAEGEAAWAAEAPTEVVDEPQTLLAPGVDGIHHLRVTTSADSWVEILDADGEKLEMDLLRAGVSRDYSGRPPFDVTVGRAAAVELELDGAPYPMESADGDAVARLRVVPNEP